MRRSDRDRFVTLHQFLDSPPCCLDQGLGVALRSFATSAEDYAAGALLHEFLITLFERVVVTSTQVELLFSKLAKILVTISGI